jgi:recombination protein RecA
MPAKKKPGAVKPPPVSSPVVTPAKDKLSPADRLRKDTRAATSAKSVPDAIDVMKLDVISSGSLALDDALGVGGWAVGGWHSVEGEPGAGKTALVLQSIGTMQRLSPEGFHVFIDVESTFDEKFAKLFGVDTNPDRLIIMRPESAEEACKMCMMAMGYREDAKHFWKQDETLPCARSISYDSWAGSPTENVGLSQLARVGSEWIPKISLTAKRLGVTIFWINQIREKPGVTFGDPRYSPGGKALKFAQVTRAWVTMVNAIKNAERVQIAHDARIVIQKNKVAPPFQKVDLHLNYSSGFDSITDAIEFFKRYGVDFKVQKEDGKDGNTYKFGYITEEGGAEEIIAVGIDKFKEELQANPEAGEAFLIEANALAQEAKRIKAVAKASGEKASGEKA